MPVFLFINHKLIDACYDLFAYLLKGEQRFKLVGVDMCILHHNIYIV
jgi:hypothetical protein